MKIYVSSIRLRSLIFAPQWQSRKGFLTQSAKESKAQTKDSFALIWLKYFRLVVSLKIFVQTLIRDVAALRKIWLTNMNRCWKEQYLILDRNWYFSVLIFGGTRFHKFQADHKINTDKIMHSKSCQKFLLYQTAYPFQVRKS